MSMVAPPRAPRKRALGLIAGARAVQKKSWNSSSSPEVVKSEDKDGVAASASQKAARPSAKQASSTGRISRTAPAGAASKRSTRVERQRPPSGKRVGPPTTASSRRHQQQQQQQRRAQKRNTSEDDEEETAVEPPPPPSETPAADMATDEEDSSSSSDLGVQTRRRKLKTSPSVGSQNDPTHDDDDDVPPPKKRRLAPTKRELPLNGRSSPVHSDAAAKSDGGSSSISNNHVDTKRRRTRPRRDDDSAEWSSGSMSSPSTSPSRSPAPPPPPPPPAPPETEQPQPPSPTPVPVLKEEAANTDEEEEQPSAPPAETVKPTATLFDHMPPGLPRTPPVVVLDGWHHGQLVWWNRFLANRKRTQGTGVGNYVGRVVDLDSEWFPSVPDLPQTKARLRSFAAAMGRRSIFVQSLDEMKYLTLPPRAVSLYPDADPTRQQELLAGLRRAGGLSARKGLALVQMIEALRHDLGGEMNGLLEIEFLDICMRAQARQQGPLSQADVERLEQLSVWDVLQRRSLEPEPREMEGIAAAPSPEGMFFPVKRRCRPVIM